MTATKVILDLLLSKIDKEAWRRNLPLTGDRDTDIAKLQETFGRHFLIGSKWDPLKSEMDSESLQGFFCYNMAQAALKTVDWDQVLAFWEPEARNYDHSLDAIAEEDPLLAEALKNL